MSKTTQVFENLVAPVVLSLASLAMMVYGFFGESWCIGFGFVCLASVIVGGLIHLGAAHAVMKPHSENRQNEHKSTVRSA